MFVYLISEVLCNIYQVCMTKSRKGVAPDLLQRLNQEKSLLKSISKEPGRKIIFYVFNLSLFRKS